MKSKFLLSITIILTALIFVHSAMSADASSSESGWVLSLITHAAALLHIPIELTEHIVRKAAHFTEYAILGIFLSWTIHERHSGFAGQRFKVLFFLLIIPVIDETIQYFPTGRSAEVRDVLLDFCGAVFGSLIVMLLTFAARKKHRSERKSES